MPGKPIVLLFTRDDCQDKDNACTCPLARILLQSVANRCDAKEMNLTRIAKAGLGDPNYDYFKYARARGYRVPLFLVKHPDDRMPEVKVHGFGRRKEFNSQIIKKELNDAITAVWKVLNPKGGHP